MPNLVILQSNSVTRHHHYRYHLTSFSYELVQRIYQPVELCLLMG